MYDRWLRTLATVQARTESVYFRFLYVAVYFSEDIYVYDRQAGDSLQLKNVSWYLSWNSIAYPQSVQCEHTAMWLHDIDTLTLIPYHWWIRLTKSR